MNGDADKTPPQSQDSVDEKGDIRVIPQDSIEDIKEIIILDDDDEESCMKNEDSNKV